MKVVLLQDVKKLGKRGDVVEVSDGYGRNVLIRRGLGQEGTKANLNNASQRKASKEFKDQVAADEAVIMASQLKDVKLTIPVHCGEDGRIFGSVTAKDISDALKKEYKFDLDKKNIRIKTPIKTLGEYDVSVWVHQQVTSTIHVSVVSDAQ
jgi:large subunit ribosomal protein L9